MVVFAYMARVYSTMAYNKYKEEYISQMFIRIFYWVVVIVVIIIIVQRSKHHRKRREYIYIMKY